MKKVVDGVTTEYRMAGSLIVSERTGDETIWYQYDSAARLVAMVVGGVRYNYVRNVQNDIIGLIDSAGKRVVSYKYDSWGKTISITGTLAATIGKKNPFRYRGYYFDAESSMYYLQSRYYDPEIRRFVSADKVDITFCGESLCNKNLYAYCDGNPIVRVEISGGFWGMVLGVVGIMAVGGAVGAVINVAISVVSQEITTGEVNLKSVGVAAVSGFIGGAVAASPIAVKGQMIVGGILGGATYRADCYVNGEEPRFDELIISIVCGIGAAAYGGDGANVNMVLSKRIAQNGKAIRKYMGRACTEYAAKRIAESKEYLKSSLIAVAVETGGRFFVGNGIVAVATPVCTSLFDELSVLWGNFTKGVRRVFGI